MHKIKLYEFFAEYENRLDEGLGDFKIDTAECLKAINRKIWEENGNLYLMHAFSILCNHIHFMFEAAGQYDLEKVMNWLKCNLSKVINNVLERGNAPCFQKDFFSRIVRSKYYYFQYENYIWNNPKGQDSLPNRWSLLRSNSIPDFMVNRWPVTSHGIIVGYERHNNRYYPVYKWQVPGKEKRIGCLASAY